MSVRCSGKPRVRLLVPVEADATPLLLDCTPGVMSSSEYTLRSTIGRLSMALASTVFEMSAVAVLTTGASPSTVMDSARPPTSSATSTLTVSLMLRTMPLRVTLLKPDSTTSMLYLPMGRNSSR